MNSVTKAPTVSQVLKAPIAVEARAMAAKAYASRMTNPEGSAKVWTMAGELIRASLIAAEAVEKLGGAQ